MSDNIDFRSLLYLTISQDYVVQYARFGILEEVGCADAPIGAGLEVLLMDSVSVLLPLASLILYSREYERDSGYSYLLLNNLSEVDIYIFQA